MESPKIYINRISTALPETEVHGLFLEEGPKYLSDERKKKLFHRMAQKGQIEKRYSVLPMERSEAGPGLLDFYKRGAFPSTAERMRRYRGHALPLALKALAPWREKQVLEGVTHLIVTSCTGFYAPGLDIDLVQALRLNPSVERTIIGFMGCYAAFNGLKQAYHIARSEPSAKVLMVNLELCTLHFQEGHELEPMLGFLIFADGCAASLISREEAGLEITGFKNELCADEIDKITWEIGDRGFNMFLSTEVPQAIGRHLPEKMKSILGGRKPEDISLWALHPGGRAILDTIQEKLGVPEDKMAASREVLRDCGNMSSASVMFVLRKHLEDVRSRGNGVALAFGPGLTVESMEFHKNPL